MWAVKVKINSRLKNDFLVLLQIIQKTMPMKPGSLVICVDDKLSPRFKPLFSKQLVKNQLYVVREIIHNYDVRNGPPGVALEEIRGLQVTFKAYTGQQVTIEVHFKMKRFKEVLPPISLEEVLEQVCTEPELVNA